MEFSERMRKAIQWQREGRIILPSLTFLELFQKELKQVDSTLQVEILDESEQFKIVIEGNIRVVFDKDREISNPIFFYEPLSLKAHNANLRDNDLLKAAKKVLKPAIEAYIKEQGRR